VQRIREEVNKLIGDRRSNSLKLAFCGVRDDVEKKGHEVAEGTGFDLFMEMGMQICNWMM
jgi:hypothetical protein